MSRPAGTGKVTCAWTTGSFLRSGSGSLRRRTDSGFTTVRDMAGGDYGTWRAIEEGLIRGPRFFYAGRALSQTGGHGDHRGPAGLAQRPHPGASESTTIVDGVDQVR